MARILVYALSAVACVGLSTCSQNRSSDDLEVTPAKASTDVAKDGARVFIDPVTGAIREPTPEDIAALNAQPRQAAAAAKTSDSSPQRAIVYPDGTVAVVLDGSHDQNLQSCVQPDGSFKRDRTCDKNKPTVAKRP